MCSDGWMNLDRTKTTAPLPCGLVRAMLFFICVEHDNGQTAQRTEIYLGFCPRKKADFSYTYISINYRLQGFYEYLNRHMEDQKEFNCMRVEFGFKS